MNNKLVRIVDLLSLILFALMMVSSRYNPNVLTDKYVVYICWTFLLFFFCRFVNSLLKGKQTMIWLLLLALFCGYEIVLGVLQLTGILPGAFTTFVLTGSFNNPAPYSGLLVACICAFLPHIIENNQPKAIRITLIIEVIIACSLLPTAGSRAAILALLVSLLFMGLANETIRQKISKYKILIISGILLLSIGGYFLKKTSADGRFFIARRSMSIIASNGVKGEGLANFSRAYGEEKVRYFSKLMSEDSDDMKWENIRESERMNCDNVLYAFNDYLQLGVECGAVSMIMFCLICIIAIICSYKSGNNWSYPFISMCVFACFSYPLMTTELRLVFVILLSLCLKPNNIDETKTYKIVLFGFSVLFMILLVNKREDCFRYIESRGMWKELHNKSKGKVDDFVIAADSMFDELCDNIDFLVEYGQYLYMKGDFEKSRSILKICTEVCDDPMLYCYMGDNSLLLKEYDVAENYYKYAFLLQPNRMYPLFGLAGLYHSIGDTTKFNFIYQKINGFVPKKETESTLSMRSNVEKLYVNINNRTDNEL